MIYAFDEYELEPAKGELRRAGHVVDIEPQVFAVLETLIARRDGLVTRDDLVDAVWNGRIVSETAISSRIKSARQAIGDDGVSQRHIKTLRGRGYRFLSDVETIPTGQLSADFKRLTPQTPVQVNAVESRPSIAVLPFQLAGVAGKHAFMADAMPQDLITELSCLRWLFVIARNSSFQLRGQDASLDHVRSRLKAAYCLSGVLEFFGGRMAVMLELADTRTGGVVWADRIEADLDTVHEVRAQMVSHIVRALDLNITSNEAQSARLKPTENLDAWSLYHLGLERMYRFNRADNEAASDLFGRAIALDNQFARAQAGLSFTYHQTALLRYDDNADAALKASRKAAEKALELDGLDPFSNHVMGRALYLGGEVEAGMPWLERAVHLCPNYAQALYTRGMSDFVCGRADACDRNIDKALALSPIDPLSYAMIAARAFTSIIREDYGAAAVWSRKSSQTPGAHILITMIDLVASELAGDGDRSGRLAAQIRQKAPNMSRAEFFRSFPFQQELLRRRIEQPLLKYGF